MSRDDPMMIPYYDAAGRIQELPEHLIDQFAEELGQVADKLNSQIHFWAERASKTDSFIVDDVLHARLAWLVGHRAGSFTELRHYLRVSFVKWNYETCASNVAKALSWDVEDPVNMTRPWFLDRWFEHNCPVVRIDERTAAGLALTSVPSSIAEEDIYLPWKAFKIALPLNLIPSTKTGAFYSRIEIHIEEASSVASRRWFLTAIDDTGHIDQLVRETFEELVRPKHWQMIGPDQVRRFISELGETLEQDDIEDFLEFMDENHVKAPKEYRVIALLLARIVCGTILFMTEPTALKKKVQRDVPRWRQAQREKEPRTTDYILLPPSEMKFPNPAEAVAAMLRLARGEKGRNIQLLQWMVRGHWRHQAHGLGLRERKWIWVAPYWKGPDNAKRVVREKNVTHRDER